jgi:sulfopyruvate decarboxylase TPP-binding subunit
MTTEVQAVAQSVDAGLIVREIVALGITHVITVPDSFQKAMLSRLEAEPSIRVLTVCTEDEAMGINAGLYAGGARSMLVVQNNGLLACLNTIKAIALDAQVPTFMTVGQFGRNVNKRVEDNKQNRAVYLLEPTLDTWSVPYLRLEGPDDLGNVRRAYEKAIETSGPSALLIGAPTR